MRSEVNRVAGPSCTRPVGAPAVWGLLEPSGARATVGVGPVSGCAPPNSEMLWAM